MHLLNSYFKKNYYYKSKFVNKCIVIIRFSKNEKRVEAYKNLVFKMMKDIVKKNIFNYFNLLQNAPRKDLLPDKDELVGECYIIFSKCVEKYAIGKNYNFYFYFNKSLSRKFFRDYQKELQKNYTVELTESIATSNSNFHDNQEPDTVEIFMEQLRLTEVEKRICHSRMLGQKTSEFLEQNPDINNAQYSRSLKRIKEILIIQKEKGEI